jgi:adenine-specific DNA-methyltransferase
MEQRPVGRLELTWTNKHLRLLAEEDGSYQWVTPSDHRVAEVRLLKDAGMVGEVDLGARARASASLLIRGDALHALLSLTRLPEFEAEYAGKVRLVYIDPPFNTQQSFLQYDDALEHSVWLTMMRDRLLQARQLMAEDGTVWVHLDDSEMAYCRVLMDEVFGRDCFMGTVIWEKSDSPRMDAKTFSVRHDYILVYGRTPTPLFKGLSYDATAADHVNKVDDEGRPYYLNPLRARGGPGSTREGRPTLYFSMIAPDGTEVYPIRPDGSDGAWRWSRAKVQRDAHLIEWIDGRKGWNPYYRIYPSRNAIRPPETMWFFKDVGSNRTSKKEIKALFPDRRPFETPKPEALIRRIIDIGTEPDDIVLDFFAGSGTTAAVAQKLGRRWVTVERSEGNVARFALPRLKMVVEGIDEGGITDEAGWEGGGGFRVLDVGVSMFEEVDGVVVLADWAVGGDLGEATAAQLGFSFDADAAPFCGIKGRCRLAVIDGRVNEQVVGILADLLGEDETMVICGTSVDPAARSALPSGSDLQKIPSSILEQYRRTYRSRRRQELGIAPAPAEDPETVSAHA